MKRHSLNVRNQSLHLMSSNCLPLKTTPSHAKLFSATTCATDQEPVQANQGALPCFQPCSGGSTCCGGQAPETCSLQTYLRGPFLWTTASGAQLYKTLPVTRKALLLMRPWQRTGGPSQILRLEPCDPSIAFDQMSFGAANQCYVLNH